MKLKIFLALMILSSLFMGISINGHWGSLWQYEFVDFLAIIRQTKRPIAFSFWIIAVLSHVVIVTLPFITQYKNFRKILWIAPITYIIGMTAQIPFLFILLIPFIFFWILSLNAHKKQ